MKYQIQQKKILQNFAKKAADKEHVLMIYKYEKMLSNSENVQVNQNYII